MVDLIGPHQTIDDFAAAAGTIGYEVLTGLGQRLQRVYATHSTDRAADDAPMEVFS
jgi:alanine racemase